MARSAQSSPFWSPQFFKVVIPNVTTQHLRIPSDFMKHTSNEESDRAILEGPTGSQWHVKLCKTEKGTFLQDGWQDFFKFLLIPIKAVIIVEKEHSGTVKPVFIYETGIEAVAEKRIKREDIPMLIPSDSESQEKTITEDKDAAESFSSIHPYFKIQMAHVHVILSFVLHTPREFSKKYLPSADAKIILRNPSGNCFTVNFINRKGRHYFAGGWRAFVREAQLKKGDICVFKLRIPTEFMKYISNEESERAILKGPSGSQWHIELCRTEKGTFLQDGWQDFVRYMKLVFIYETGIEAVAEKRIKREDIPMLIPSDSESQENMTIEDKDAKLKMSAESFTSIHPYFKTELARKKMTQMKVYRGFMLHLPREFSKKYLPSTNAEIILRNPSGKYFTVNFRNNKGNRHYFSGGWSAFVRENKLSKGSICIFELVGKSEFSVHIFPVAHRN
ncbi:B3 domain-containing transcription factor VRN1-like [Papaver somniferum]|uniref:B3 domain-containing transcription factor VRN1-like n=1 Tax=Papaver somniferum TaxID=3469 RepID=UPI000E6F6F0E|nr:B3 domain-containing transcription factor VRN1-like [Papaver somniferum]